MYSGYFGKHRVDPAQSRMVLAAESKVNCVGCAHCMRILGRSGAGDVTRTHVCMSVDPPRVLGTWMTVRPVWCPLDDSGVRPPAESTASDTMQLCLLVAFMLLICWCLSGCRGLDLPLLR